MEIQLPEDMRNHVFQNILDAIDVAVTVVDCDGITTFYNNAASKMEGLNPKDVLGKHLFSVYPSLNESNSSLLKVLKTGRPIVNQQQTIVANTGKKITTIYSTYPLLKGDKIIGAFDVSRDITEIKNLSERVVDLQAKLANNKNSFNKSYVRETLFDIEDIIGNTSEIVNLKKLVKRVAYSPSPILIYGETGTGKEVIAQAIHNEGISGSQINKPFVAQNCAALPATLLESILMGTVKGSFTGAENRPGLFEIAHGGTLLLDEINSMPLELQSKILRVLQEGTIRRVGDARVRCAKPRIIACTNIDPLQAVKDKKLRADLYYRLNVVSLRIPPLRERKADIPLFVDEFLKQLNEKFHIRIKGIEDEVMSLFTSYKWPGNVRELQHCLEHAANVMNGSIIRMEHLPDYLTKHFSSSVKQEQIMECSLSKASSLPEAVAMLETKLIKAACVTYQLECDTSS